MKMNPKIEKLRQQAGYTLVELSIAVAIIAALIGAGLYGVPRILDTNKVSVAAQQAALANANHSKMASTTSDMSFATVAVAYAANAAVANPYAAMGLWPDEAVLKTAGSIQYGVQHPFGGYIYPKAIGTALVNSLGVNEGYILKYDAVPSRVCVALTSALAATATQVLVGAPAAATSGPMLVDPAIAAGIVAVKTPTTALSINALSAQCALNPTITKNIYAWYPF